MLKRLWQILGPIFCAIILAMTLIGLFPNQIRYSASSEKKDAVALSVSNFKSRYKKNRALTDSNINFVPFFGSSEWSRFDKMHPSVIAEAYNRNYTPYLLGQKGAASLTHYFGSQEFSNALQGKQAVYFISPQWFVKKGANANAFKNYLSAGQVVEFLINQKGTKYDRYAASRLLELYPEASLKEYISKVADGSELSQSDKSWLKLKRNILQKEDNFFSQFTIDYVNHAKVLKQVKKLPENFSYEELEALAIKDGEKATSNNEFHIQNQFYSTRIAHQKNKLKGSQKFVNYTKSPEYQDLQLMLQQFAKSKTNVLFIIPPVNKKWVKYTGLNQDMYQEAVKKIKYQLQSQGFTNIADFSKDGDKPYFMQDTIHIGWTGWLAIDKEVEPFLTKQAEAPAYKLDDKFLTSSWANYRGNPVKF